MNRFLDNCKSLQKKGQKRAKKGQQMLILAEPINLQPSQSWKNDFCAFFSTLRLDFSRTKEITAKRMVLSYVGHFLNIETKWWHDYWLLGFVYIRFWVNLKALHTCKQILKKIKESTKSWNAGQFVAKLVSYRGEHVFWFLCQKSSKSEKMFFFI